MYARAPGARGVVHLVAVLAPGDVAGYGERQPTPFDLPEEADPDLDGESRAVLAPLGPSVVTGSPEASRRHNPAMPSGRRIASTSVMQRESNSSRV
jgi:hypothetical protein